MTPSGADLRLMTIAIFHMKSPGIIDRKLRWCSLPASIRIRPRTEEATRWHGIHPLLLAGPCSSEHDMHMLRRC